MSSPYLSARQSSRGGGRLAFLPCMLLVILMVNETAAREQRTRETERIKSRKGPTSGTLVVTKRPRSTERQAERSRMVANQIAARGVNDEAVLEAMRNVPRHWFVPDNVQRAAYADRPLPIGDGQTISQPYIVAFMTEGLSLTAESRVLEIGTGSGYQAAVFAEITPHVYTIEIVEPLAKRAMETFKRHGYQGIHVKIGDGYAGWPEHAPFDAIMVTCAPDHLPRKLFEQLKPGGSICIPVGPQHAVQSLKRITKTQDGGMVTTTLMPVRFVPMTGKAQGAQGDDR